jgi:hypothetical protein
MGKPTGSNASTAPHAYSADLNLVGDHVDLIWSVIILLGCGL